MEVIQFTATKTKKFKLVPIGTVKLSFEKRRGTVYIGGMNIYSETAMTLSKEHYKILQKIMKANKTDLLTDGTKFYTTTGDNQVVEIYHNSFDQVLIDSPEVVDMHEYLQND